MGEGRQILRSMKCRRVSFAGNRYPVGMYSRVRGHCWERKTYFVSLLRSVVSKDFKPRRSLCEDGEIPLPGILTQAESKAGLEQYYAGRAEY